MEIESAAEGRRQEGRQKVLLFFLFEKWAAGSFSSKAFEIESAAAQESNAAGIRAPREEGGYTGRFILSQKERVTEVKTNCWVSVDRGWV